MKELIESDKSSEEIISQLTEGSWSGDTYYGDEFTAVYKPNKNELWLITDMEDVGGMATGPQMAVSGPGQFEGVDDMQVAQEIVKELERIGIDNMDLKKAKDVAQTMGVNFKHSQEGLPF